MEQLEKIKHWAMNRSEISILILSGSLAGKGKKDELSDYDIAVYGSNFNFIQNDDWLRSIEDYCVCIHSSFELMSYTIPSRLTIFNPYFKVDFSFHPLEPLRELTQKLPWDYDMGYEILIDKNGLAQKMVLPSYRSPLVKKPSAEDFRKTVDEFWFEVYHVAKYLRRGDLWTVKFRDWQVKENLRQMIEWHKASRMNWSFGPKNFGKGMKDWIDKKIWDDLFSCFGGFDEKDSWKTLKNTIKLYRELATETATSLGFTYNQNQDHTISAFVKESKKVLNLR